MTTAVAAPPVTAPHAPPSLEPAGPSRTYPPIAPSTSLHIATPNSKNSRLVSDNASPTSSDSSSQHQQRPEGKRSPNSYVVYTSLFLFIFFFPSPTSPLHLTVPSK